MKMSNIEQATKIHFKGEEEFAKKLMDRIESGDYDPIDMILDYFILQDSPNSDMKDKALNLIRERLTI